MRLVSLKGQTVGLRVDIPGSDGQTKEVTVGPEPIDLSEVDAKAILNLYGSVVKVVSDTPKAAEPPLEIEPKPKVRTGIVHVQAEGVDYEPKLDEPPPERVVPAGQYWCTKCGRTHMLEGSKIGAEHLKHKE